MGVRRLDAVVAGGFVLAAGVEALVRHSAPGPAAFHLGGAPLLAVLALRRIRPVATIGAIATAGLAATLVQRVLWPHADDSGGAWIIAMMVAAYSLGAHGRGRSVALGGLLPLVVVLAADVGTVSGWDLVSSLLFITAFIGVLPTAAGRLVRARRERLAHLAGQRERILAGQAARRESAVLAERVQTAERLQPLLLEGLRALADSAESTADAAVIEEAARELLGRTREEVVALTAPVEGPYDDPGPSAGLPDHLGALRAAAQPWAVLAGGGITVGLALESTSALPLATPAWVAAAAAVAVGAPLMLAWWRPLPTVTVALAAAAAFSHLVGPLEGTLSQAAIALSTAFAVAMLTRRPEAVAGLMVCWLGQLLEGTDPGGEVLVAVYWCGGIALHETVRLVEQSRANNRLLAAQEMAGAQRAIVDERLRIAREIHDQIGHSLTVVALQAGAARRLPPSEAERAREVMRTIAIAARAGVDALDATRTRDLACLLDDSRSAGLVLDADVEDYAALEPREQAVVYRVVQEALTNVLRHAPGARASVVVCRAGDEVAVAVRNTAPTPMTDAAAGAERGSARGLAGIRERVDLLGGNVEWGPDADGGFQVRATAPLGRLAGASR